MATDPKAPVTQADLWFTALIVLVAASPPIHPDPASASAWQLARAAILDVVAIAARAYLVLMVATVALKRRHP